MLMGNGQPSGAGSEGSGEHREPLILAGAPIPGVAQWERTGFGNLGSSVQS